jgi:hypothetical protein
MDDGVDVVAPDGGADEVGVAGIADDQGRPRRHGLAEPGRKIVEYDDVLAGAQELENHVAADIAGAACHQNGH